MSRAPGGHHLSRRMLGAGQLRACRGEGRASPPGSLQRAIWGGGHRGVAAARAHWGRPQARLNGPRGCSSGHLPGHGTGGRWRAPVGAAGGRRLETAPPAGWATNTHGPSPTKPAQPSGPRRFSSASPPGHPSTLGTFPSHPLPSPKPPSTFPQVELDDLRRAERCSAGRGRCGGAVVTRYTSTGLLEP